MLVFWSTLKIQDGGGFAVIEKASGEWPEDREWTRWGQGQRGVVVGFAAVATSFVTWQVAKAVSALTGPFFIILLYLSMLAALGAGFVGGYLAARAMRARSPELLAIVGALATAAVTRAGAAGLGASIDTAAFWLVACACAVAVYGLAAVLVTPRRSRGWWVARVVVAAAVVATVPLAPAVADDRKVAGEEAKFAALDAPLVMVNVSGYRAVNARVRPDQPDVRPTSLDLTLSPEGDDYDYKQRITVSVVRAHGPVDCAVLTGSPDLYGTWGVNHCKAPRDDRMVLDGLKGSVVIVGHGAVARLSIERGSSLTTDDLLVAHLRSADASELAAVNRRR